MLFRSHEHIAGSKVLVQSREHTPPDAGQRMYVLVPIQKIGTRSHDFRKSGNLPFGLGCNLVNVYVAAKGMTRQRADRRKPSFRGQAVHGAQWRAKREIQMQSNGYALAKAREPRAVPVPIPTSDDGACCRQVAKLGELFNGIRDAFAERKIIST